jgi:hypothetical protein
MADKQIVAALTEFEEHEHTPLHNATQAVFAGHR